MDLSPAGLEAVAAQLVRLKFPEWFPSVTVSRQGPETRTGWPDGFYRNDAGEIFAVEATQSRTAPQLRAHLDEDLKKATSYSAGQLRAFVFVAGRARLPRADHGRYQDAFSALGIEARFFDHPALVSELEDRLFRTIWAQLGVDDDPFPFRRLEDALIFGAGSDTDILPSPREFAEELVYVSPTAAVVQERLRTRRIAIVRSQAASGKTVLATQIGLAWQRDSGTDVYYIDCANDAQNDAMKIRAYDSFQRRLANGVLFIADNIHADPTLVRTLADMWRRRDGGAALLLLGKREDDTVPDGLDLNTALGDDDQPVSLTIDDDGLRGIFRRLAKRVQPSGDLPDVDEAALESWRDLQGDLVTLTLALNHRLHDETRHDLEITAEDATAFVRTRYFEEDELSEDERDALLDVAALGVLELGPDEDLIKPRLLQKAKEKGAVRGGVPHGARKLSKTVHSNYAKALLHAGAPESIDDLHLHRLARLCKARPELLWPVIRKLDTRDATDLASDGRRRYVRDELIKVVLPASDELAAARSPLPPNLSLLRDALNQLLSSGHLSVPAIQSAVLANHELLAAGVLRSDILDLQNVVEDIADTFPAVARFVLGLMTEPDAVGAVITASVRNRSTTTLERFLVHDDQTRLRPLVLNWLNDPVNATEVARQLGGLEHVAPVVTALRAIHAEDVAAAMIAALVREAPMGRNRPLHEDVTALITQMLVAAPARANLDAQLLNQLLGLGCAWTVRRLHEDAGARVEIGRRLAGSPIRDLRQLIRRRTSDRFHSIIDELVSAISLETWERSVSQSPPTPWDWYVLARALREAGRKDLGQVSAYHVLAPANDRAWLETRTRREPISILAWACITAYRHQDGGSRVERLLSTVCTPAWIEEAYPRNRTLGLAATLYSAGLFLPGRIVDLIVRPGFAERVNRESELLQSLSGNRLIRAIGLIGAASVTLAGYRAPTELPAADALAEALRTWHNNPGNDQRLNHRAAAIWTGLHAISRAGSHVEVPRDVASHVLQLWERAHPPSDRHQAIRDEVLLWLRGLVTEG